MHRLAQRLLIHIRRQELLKAGDRVGVAVSGGIDSIALLRLLIELRAELGIVLSVVHFNHKLRGAESDADEQFVGALAKAHDLEFHTDDEDVAHHAREQRVSLEAAARELRYGFFRYLIGSEVGEESASGAAAQGPLAESYRNAGSAGPPEGFSSHSGPQGLKPDPDDPRLRGAEAPLFHDNSDHDNFDLGNTGRGNFGRDSRSGSADAGLPILSQKPREGWGNHVSPKLNKILTGHTLDDQAETVLMRLIRGSGMRGIGGIYPRLAVEDASGELCGEIIRPLLPFRRGELEHYLREIEQPWREDSSNADDAFTRNRLRKLVLPVLENEFNPSIAENLSDLADIARGEEDYWENEISGWMGTVVHWTEPAWVQVSAKSGLVNIAPAGDGRASAENSDLASRIEDSPWLVMNASVSRAWFLTEAEAVQRRLVKAIGGHAGIPLEFKHVEEIRRFSGRESEGNELSLPLGWKFVRDCDELMFLTPDLRTEPQHRDYEYDLAIPGRVSVCELDSAIEAVCISAEAVNSYNPDHLLNAELLSSPLRLRNWRAGDRFWPAHTKSAKKIKELLHERQIHERLSNERQSSERQSNGPERKLWPVISTGPESGDEIIWMSGFPTPARFAAKPGQNALLIKETPLSRTDE